MAIKNNKTKLRPNLRAWERSLSAVVSVCLLLMMLLVVGEIIGRSVFNHPIRGQYELVAILMGVVIFLGFSDAQAMGSHVSVELFVRRLPERLQRATEVVGLFLSLGILCLVFWSTVRKVMSALKLGEVISGVVLFPTWPVVSIMALGIFTICLRLAIQIALRGARKTSDQSELEAEDEYDANDVGI